MRGRGTVCGFSGSLRNRFMCRLVGIGWSRVSGFVGGGGGGSPGAGEGGGVG